MIGPVNRWQEVLHELCYETDLVEPKRIARRLHKAYDYCSDICRRERVDPLAVFNEILKDAERFSESEPGRLVITAGMIFNLLTEGTRWTFEHIAPYPARDLEFDRLCEQTGALLEDLGGAIKALARAYADGRIDAADDPDIDSFLAKSGQLIARLRAIGADLQLRRRQEAST